MKYPVGAFIFSSLLLLLADTTAQTHKKKAYKFDHSSRRSFNDTDVVDSNWMSPNYFVPCTTADKFGLTGLECKDPFNEEEALFKIFPGNHYDVHDDERHPYLGEGIAIWRCKDCTIKKVDDDYPHSFPRKNGNLTEVFKVKYFKDDSGQRNVLVAFQTNDISSLDEMYMGNCKGADMSLALFKLYDNKWRLTNFTLFAGCLGTYQHLPHDIDPIKLGNNNYGVEVRTECYNPGGPGWGHLILYGLIDGQFRELLNTPSSRYMSMPCNEWGTAIKRQKDTLTFSDLKTITEGDFCRQVFTDGIYDTAIDVPDEAYRRTATADSFGFRITKQYHFENNHYKLKKTYTQYSAVKPRKK